MSARATSDEARRHYLIALRDNLGFTQATMARSLGMSLRSYSDLETGGSRCRTVHVLAAERVTLREATAREDASLIAQPVRQEIAKLGERVCS